MNQKWNPKDYQQHAGFVPRLATATLELLDAEKGERILDLGCGDGVITKDLSDQGCIMVGVDESPEMIAAAKAKGLDARVMNGAALTFANEFDAVFSNAALHWMKDNKPVIAGVHRALKPGGRFVAEMGGAGNVAAIEAAIHAELKQRGIDPQPLNPWFFPTPADYQPLLEHAGFRVEHISLHTRPTPLPGDIGAWLTTFAKPFLKAVAEGERGAFIDHVRARLEPLLHADGVWTADYCRLRFKAVRAS